MSIMSAVTLQNVLMNLVPFLYGAECIYELNIIFAPNTIYF
jgi:hypothetical protein